MNRRPSLRHRAISLAVAFAIAACSPATTSPSPSPGPAGGDPRSSGEGPGLAGDPLFAIVAVLAIGIASLVVTYVYVRLTAGRTRS